MNNYINFATIYLLAYAVSESLNPIKVKEFLASATATSENFKSLRNGDFATSLNFREDSEIRIIVHAVLRREEKSGMRRNTGNTRPKHFDKFFEGKKTTTKKLSP